MAKMLKSIRLRQFGYWLLILCDSNRIENGLMGPRVVIIQSCFGDPRTTNKRFAVAALKMAPFYFAHRSVSGHQLELLYLELSRRVTKLTTPCPCDTIIFRINCKTLCQSADITCNLSSDEFSASTCRLDRRLPFLFSN